MRIAFHSSCEIWLGLHELDDRPSGMKGNSLYPRINNNSITHIYRSALPIRLMTDMLVEFAFVEEIIDPSANDCTMLDLTEERYALFLLTYS